MENNTLNGSTEEKSRRNENSLYPYSASKLGCSQEKGTDIGIKQNRVNQFNSRGESGDRRTQRSNGDSGKILERLEFIQKEYISYLEGHQQSLLTQLEKNKEKEKTFKIAIQELEHEIHTLISKNQSEQ